MDSRDSKDSLFERYIQYNSLQSIELFMNLQTLLNFVESQKHHRSDQSISEH